MRDPLVRALVALGALAACLGLGVSFAAAAGRTGARTVTVDATGPLTVAWSGDPARGCAAAGQCGVSGDLEVLPSGTQSGSPLQPLELADSNAVARVIQRAPNGAVQSTCVDPVPVDLSFSVRRVAGGRRAFIDDAFQPMSAGRCAGPTSADLATFSLPARPVGAHSYDLSGQTSFGAGPFDVTVISGVQVHVTVTRGSLGPVTAPPLPRAPKLRTRHVLRESAVFDYRIEGISGSLGTGFAGVAPPLCQSLGACGATGQLTSTFTASGVIAFSGSRTVKRRVGSAAALADLRGGRMILGDNFFFSHIHESETETLAESDDVTCSDLAHGPVFAQSSGRRGSDELQLGGESGPFGGVDALRTRCPGPSSQDVFGDRPAVLARGTLTSGQLGRPQLTLTLSTAGGFRGSAYQGDRGGSVVLHLTLVRASGGTRRVTVVFATPRTVVS